MIDDHAVAFLSDQLAWYVPLEYDDAEEISLGHVTLPTPKASNSNFVAQPSRQMFAPPYKDSLLITITLLVCEKVPLSTGWLRLKIATPIRVRAYGILPAQGS